MYVIRCVNDHTLYWNNIVGWTDLEYASRFSLGIKTWIDNNNRMCLEGEWLELPKT